MEFNMLNKKDSGPFVFVTIKKYIDGTVTPSKVTRRFESLEEARNVLYMGSSWVGSERGYDMKKMEPEHLVYANLKTGTVTSISIALDRQISDDSILLGA